MFYSKHTIINIVRTQYLLVFAVRFIKASQKLNCSWALLLCDRTALCEGNPRGLMWAGFRSEVGVTAKFQHTLRTFIFWNLPFTNPRSATAPRCELNVHQINWNCRQIPLGTGSTLYPKPSWQNHSLLQALPPPPLIACCPRLQNCSYGLSKLASDLIILRFYNYSFTLYIGSTQVFSLMGAVWGKDMKNGNRWTGVGG